MTCQIRFLGKKMRYAKYIALAITIQNYGTQQIAGLRIIVWFGEKDNVKYGSCRMIAVVHMLPLFRTLYRSKMNFAVEL